MSADEQHARPESPPRRTPLHSLHRAAGASMIEFGGWEMPVRYRTTIPEEHEQVRARAGLFDLCHMGRLEFRGAGVTSRLDRILTNHYAAMRLGEARYTLICDDGGKILDDAIVYKVAQGSEERALLVVNASNRQRIVEWIESRGDDAGAPLQDRTEEIAMLSIQGPRSAEILSEVWHGLAAEIASLKYYSIACFRFPQGEVSVARTGYTGEDGFEVYLDSAAAPALWQRLLETAGDRLLPIGLGARDTLRLEAAMPLYGHEIDESTDPFEARLGFAVKLDKPGGFIGCEALRAKKERQPVRRLTGFRMQGRRSARQGMELFVGTTEVGVITSGAPSPTLGYPIALGYLEGGLDETELAALEVDVRGKREAIATHPLPFFSRKRKQS